MMKAIMRGWPAGLAPNVLPLAAGLVASTMAASTALAPGRTLGPAREPPAAVSRHAACVAGFRAVLSGLPGPLPSAKAMLASLRSSGSALLDVCAGEPMAEAVAAERTARWMDGCQLRRPEGVTCERLRCELALYRNED